MDAVENDEHAINSFNKIHNTNFEVQDVRLWDKEYSDIDLITYGSPCQDFSVAGKQAGGDENSGTRSSLVYEALRIVGKIKPKYVLFENVKNILGKKHRHNFDEYLKRMEDMGYTTYYQVLNAKDYGMPQNRERVYTISIRNDIDKADFVFPEKEELKLRLKDMLEKEVDEKYYLSEKNIKCYQREFGSKGKEVDIEDIAPTLTAAMGTGGGNVPIVEDNKCIQVGDLCGGKWDKINESCRRVYSEQGISPTIHTCQGGNTEPKVLVEDKIKVVGNYMPSGHDTSRIVDGDGIAPTVKENHGTVTAVAIVDESVKPSVAKNFEREKEEIINSDKEIYQCECDSGWQDNKVGLKVSPTLRANNNNTFAYTGVRIRKLTPKECWRLMGFDDEDFEKAAQINSNTQLYKQAGNSIVVNVLEKIFENLLKGENTNENK